MHTSLTRRQEAALARWEQAARNENAHTRHVTALALTLFDAVRTPWGFTAKERRLLELAGRLHDIGYARDPLDHARVSAAMAGRNRTLGLAAEERRTLSALILLHSRRDYRASLRDPLFRRLPRRETALRLGALLRVADGLDNGHVQDAGITKTRLAGGRLIVRVRAAAWRRNLVAARRKADLWNDAMPGGLRLKEEKVSGAWERLCRRLPAPEAARILLALEYRSFMATLDGAVDGDAEALHQARIALRRCRLLLRAFGPALPRAAGAAARTELDRLTESLGPARDLDVWRALLPRASAARRALERRRARAQRRVRAALTGRSLDALRVAMGRLLRIALAQPAPVPAPPTAGALADRALRKAARRARKRGRHPEDTVAGRHRLRSALRRVLLLARILSPLLPASFRRPDRRLRKAERALGRLHDLESLCATLRRPRAGAPGLESRCARQLEKARKRLARPAARRALRQLALARDGGAG